MSYRIKVRDDANRFYTHARGKVMDDQFASREDAETVCGAMINAAEFEVIEVTA